VGVKELDDFLKKNGDPSLTRTGDLTIMRQGESPKFTLQAQEK
jgi:hypothetical protein